jgi:hypothetical protein
VDEEAKVRAHAVLDGGAGIDETLQAVAPWLVFAVAVRLPQRATVTVHIHRTGLLGAIVGVVRQEDTDDAVPSSLEGTEVAGVVEVLTDEISPSRKRVVHPDLAVVAGVTVSFCLFGRHHAWAARMTVGWEESMDPQFVMNLGAALTGHGVDGTVALKIGVSIQESTTFDRGSHGVDEGVEVANDFVVLKHGQAVAQHPVGQGLHELGSLVGVETSHEGGLGQLPEVGDEFTVFGGLTDFNFVKAHVHLTCETTCFSLEGTDLIVHVKGKGSCRVAGTGFVWDVDDELAFIVANVGLALSDERSSMAASLSTSCINNISIFIVHLWHFCSPRLSKKRHSI